MVILAVVYNFAFFITKHSNQGNFVQSGPATRHIPGRKEFERFQALLMNDNKLQGSNDSSQLSDRERTLTSVPGSNTLTQAKTIGAFESLLTGSTSESYEQLEEHRHQKQESNRADSKAKRPLCAHPSAGQADIPVNLGEIPNEKDLIRLFRSKHVKNGGHWHPPDCEVDEKLAVVVPFRTREIHLLFFLKYLHRFLQHQQLHYTIFIVDQNEGSPFNRAMLFNVGFVEALREDNFTCFAFHDVDHIPVDDFLSYRCSSGPVHMAAMTDKWGWGVPYPNFAGGVTLQSTRQILLMNGFSNNFWGWGGEDDDLRQRWAWAGFHFQRPMGGHGRYATVKLNHSRSSDPNPNRMKLLRESRQRVTYDGLNTLHYHLEEKIQHPLYTRVRVVLKRIALR